MEYFWIFLINFLYIKANSTSITNANFQVVLHHNELNGTDKEIDNDVMKTNENYPMSFTIPDWQSIRKYDKIHYIEIFILVDMSTVRFYQGDLTKVKQALVPLLNGLIMYLRELNIRIIIVDIVKMHKYDVTLGKLKKYCTENANRFPKHDAVILISREYDGGIAYVNGMCGESSLAIVGFREEILMESITLFFYELAHLLGISYDIKAGCLCNRFEKKCSNLGYNDECIAQALMDKLQEHTCIQDLPEEDSINNAIPFCGNGVVEANEECDCGPQRFCTSIICNAVTCQRTIGVIQLLLILLISLLKLIIVTVVCIHCICKGRHQIHDNGNLTYLTNTWNTPNFIHVSTIFNQSTVIDEYQPVSNDERSNSSIAANFKDECCQNSQSDHSETPQLFPRIDYLNIKEKARMMIPYYVTQQNQFDELENGKGNIISYKKETEKKAVQFPFSHNSDHCENNFLKRDELVKNGQSSNVMNNTERPKVAPPLPPVK